MIILPFLVATVSPLIAVREIGIVTVVLPLYITIWCDIYIVYSNSLRAYFYLLRAQKCDCGGDILSGFSGDFDSILQYLFGHGNCSFAME